VGANDVRDFVHEYGFSHRLHLVEQVAVRSLPTRGRRALVELFRHLDPRLGPRLTVEFHRRTQEPLDGLPRGVTIVLAGHRGAGKSTVLPFVAAALKRTAIDLDVELERRAGRTLRSWFEADVASFRVAEREVFAALTPGAVVAVGGGFLSLHADLLRDCLTVLVPVTWETFAERLSADTSRPRLRPELTLQQELEAVWVERESKHLQVKTMPIVDFALSMRRPARARRVVTLPPRVDPVSFATHALQRGADVLEVRTDLTSLEVDLDAMPLPILIAERGQSAPARWKRRAAILDADDGSMRSHHAPAPMTTTEVLEHWRGVPIGVQVKHVEPLGALSEASRLLETQVALRDVFGDRVTVLATGPLALPFRAVLAETNAFDYLAAETSWSAAPGQRLLDDAVRSARRARHDGMTQRLGLLGTPLGHSRSPRLHAQPFDRIELPADVEVGALLSALKPHYRGFAVTNPFKKAAACAANANRDAVNTLIRETNGWSAANSDRDGAAATLGALTQRAETRHVTVLGDGGVTGALRDAAEQLGITLTVLTRASVQGVVRGAVVWTWPASVEAPEALCFEQALVAVIAYGAPARTLAARIQHLGGTPVRLGPRWFITQARRQRTLWESSP
jgi:shikimate kinase